VMDVPSVVAFLLSLLLIFGQEFEVASIKLSAQNAQTQSTAGLHIDRAMVRYSALSLKLYLGLAYGLKNYQISAPDWMASDRWDITAKLPDGFDIRHIPQMLQMLLRDRPPNGLPLSRKRRERNSSAELNRYAADWRLHRVMPSCGSSSFRCC